MSKMRTLAAAIALGLAGLSGISAPSAVAQERLENPAGVWIHQNSGTVFPRFLGAAERSGMTQFADDGSDVGITYDLKNGDEALLLSVYVYPKMSGLDCKGTFDDAKLSIENYRGASLLSESVEASPSGKGRGTAHHARYKIPAGSMRSDIPELVSDIYLYCSPGTNWLVKYRASWTGSASDMPDIGQMLQQIGWPDGLE